MVLITLIAPLILGIYLAFRHKGFGLYIAGAATFVVSQMLFRLPLISAVFPQFSWYVWLQLDPVWYALFLSATAGLVEEGGRWIALSWISRRRIRNLSKLNENGISTGEDESKEVSLKEGILFGLGHGGVEAVLLVGINALVSLLMWQQLSGSLAAFSPSMVLASGVERILAVIFHVGASLMVLYGIRVKRPVLWTSAAMGAHTTLNFSAVTVMQKFPGQVSLVEALIGLMAIAMLSFSLWLWKKGITEVVK